MAEETIIRFEDVVFEYLDKKPIINEANFNVRKGAKLTLMGQNGAGKSTIFKIITGELKIKSGQVSIDKNSSIGRAKQAMSRDELNLNIEEYFAQAFEEKPANIKSLISKALEAVNFQVDLDKKISDLSGGQQARLLLAYSLINKPDILLLDEPTNNLDKDGIDHLITFLIMYEKTVIVISHDADFLNCFTEGVIYLDVYSKQTELYVGDYYSVVEEINKRVEREKMKNAQLEKRIQDRKEKVNFFANKGGKMRKLAKKLKEETEELEENKVDVRKEDRTIREFEIPVQENVIGDILTIKEVEIIKDGQKIKKAVNKTLRRSDKLLISGPNGIGKSTLLKRMLDKDNKDIEIKDNIVIGYYSQDFSELDYNQTVFDSLTSVMDGIDEQEMRSIAAGFLIRGDLMPNKIEALSEGQKALLSFTRLVLMKPAILILDEPTNHINFRHIPVIAQAINDFEGAIILISHMSEFVNEIKVNDILDLNKI